MRHIIYIILTMVAAVCGALLLHSCARMGTPDGGPYDETPPHVTSTTPKERAVNFSGKKVTIHFNENIQLIKPSEKVVVSPPQLEQPEIEASGKKITIELQDSIKPNTTYTIDFADAIEDNNEGNPMGNYAFTFSSGQQVDTMQVSGTVLDGSNLEPIKGILVGLYRMESDTLPDSIFRTKPLERISRTDSRGRFSIKGLARDTKYRVFALHDQDQNYVYSQRSEMVAFSPDVIVSSCKLDIRPDTVWHDTIHYDSINYVPFTHFYPDDITLRAFTDERQDQRFLKSERPILENFNLYFTARADTLPTITGLNFDATDAFVVDASEHYDTLHYWIRDSLIYNIDTLLFQLDYLATDSTGQLSLKTDTLYLISKLTKAKIAKQQEQAWKDWEKDYKRQYEAEMRAKAEKEEEEANKEEEEAENEEEADEGSNDKQKKKKKSKKKPKKTKSSFKVDLDTLTIPPMPEEFFDIKTSTSTGMAPDKNVDITFEQPIDSLDYSKVQFYFKSDTLKNPLKHKLVRVPGKTMAFRLYAEWEPDSAYVLECDTGAFVNIYGKRSSQRIVPVSIKSLDAYSTLFLTLTNGDSTTTVQLIDGSDKPVKTVRSKNGKADFYFVNPGLYYVRAFNDYNGDGIWTPGDYDEQRQPEPMYYLSKALNLRAKWDVNETWNITATPLHKQKPLKITKQKPDKEKDIHAKNRNRLEEKGKNK